MQARIAGFAADSRRRNPGLSAAQNFSHDSLEIGHVFTTGIGKTDDRKRGVVHDFPAVIPQCNPQQLSHLGLMADGLFITTPAGDGK